MGQSAPKHKHVVDILWIVAVYGKVATETVTVIFNVAETCFLSLSNKALKKIDKKGFASKLLMSSQLCF